MPQLASVLLLLGAVAALVSLVVVHVLPTGLNPLRDPVSQYGITSYRGWYRSAALSAALAGVGGVIYFAQVPGVAALITLILLVVFAAARALIGFFPMDAPGESRTGTGRLHNILATLAFAPVTAAAFVGAGALHDAGAGDLSIWSTLCGVVMAVGAVGLLLTARATRLRTFFGLAERLIYVGFIAWFILLGVAALA
jgi:hypothetical protein